MRQKVVLRTAAGLVAALVLLPLVWPGYVLSYDMVFVPDQPLNWHLIAPVDAVPRAVPLDAAVSLASVLLPGWLLQRVILAAILYAAALGAALLVPTERTGVRLVALVGYAWTPYLAERLLIGQWGLLLAYAALPWLVQAALDLRRGRPGALPRLLLAAGISALTPSGGLLAAVCGLVLLAGIPWRRFAIVAGGLLVLNSPWLVAALVSSAGSRSDPLGVDAFAARAENWSGPIGALLGTGGIWNAEVTPTSRSAAYIPVVTVVLLVLAAIGWRVLRDRMPVGSVRLAILGACGLAVAAIGTFPAGAAALRWLVAEVPGAGLLRDGQKFLAPYALLLVLGFALGIERLTSRLPAEPAAVLTAGAILLPVAAMADLGFGGAGALRTVKYPADWDRVAAIVAEQPAELLSLPLSEYRVYSWNRYRTVIDPAPRYFDVPVIRDDVLVVGDLQLAGEDPRVAEVRRRLRTDGPAATGIGWILVQHPPGRLDDALPADRRAGLEPVYSGEHLTLYRNEQAVSPPAVSGGRLAAVLAAQLALAVVLVAAAIGMAFTRRARKSWSG